MTSLRPSDVIVSSSLRDVMSAERRLLPLGDVTAVDVTVDAVLSKSDGKKRRGRMFDVTLRSPP